MYAEGLLHQWGKPLKRKTLYDIEMRNVELGVPAEGYLVATTTGSTSFVAASAGENLL